MAGVESRACLAGRSSRNYPRVLVVDDSRDAADGLAVVVTLWGYDAEACYDGAAALEVARAYRPHVVLLDVGIPGLDGFQVALGLRTMPGLEGAVIIGVTGNTDEACRVRARDAGFDHCLVKPVDIRLLLGLFVLVATPATESPGVQPRRGALTGDGGSTRREAFAR